MAANILKLGTFPNKDIIGQLFTKYQVLGFKVTATFYNNMLDVTVINPTPVANPPVANWVVAVPKPLTAGQQAQLCAESSGEFRWVKLKRSKGTGVSSMPTTLSFYVSMPKLFGVTRSQYDASIYKGAIEQTGGGVTTTFYSPTEAAATIYIGSSLISPSGAWGSNPNISVQQVWMKCTAYVLFEGRIQEVRSDL